MAEMFGTVHLASLSTIKSVPKWSFGGKKDINETAGHIPGPGTYDLEFKSYGKHGISFPKSYRAKEGSSNVPGPGSYNPYTNLGGPKWTLAMRMAYKEKHNPIGPGFYEIKNTTKHSAPSYQFAKARREACSKKTNTPGPDTYYIKNNNPSKNYSFGIKHQKELYKSDTPSPDSYNPLWPKTNIKYSIRMKLQDSHKTLITPGPGSYKLDSSIGNGLKYSILGKEKEKTDTSSIPGPGSYNDNDKIIRPSAPKYHLGIKLPEEHFNRNIHVNQSFLNRQSSIGEGPKWSFGHSHKDIQKSSDSFPGPGAYGSIKLEDSGPKYSFSNSEKAKGVKNITSEQVGPGQYETKEVLITPSWKFGTENRHGLTKSAISPPGPGHYSPNFSQGGPHWTMRSRILENTKDLGPRTAGFMLSSFS